MKPTTPKILPWLARKADIPMHRAEILWHRACRHAAHATAEMDSPAYWAAAVDRLLELVAAERLREDAASFGWRQWARFNARLWRVPLAILDVLMLGCQRNLRSFKPSSPG